MNSCPSIDADDEGILALARPEIRALKPYASARALASSAGILLNANENPWPPTGDDGLELNRYPDPQPSDLRDELATRYAVNSDEILITRGSDEGIDLLIRTFCRAGVDRVMICPPCFGMYGLSARVQGAEVIEVPLLDQGDQWNLDYEAICAERPVRLMFLCSPNNPTGHEIKSEMVEALCQRQRGHGLVIVDEAYIEFSTSDSMTDMIERYPNLVVLRTLSKAYALAGCRIGALISRPAVVNLLRRIIAPYPLPTPSVAAARRALAEPARFDQQLAALHAEKDRLIEALSSLSSIVRLWPGQANFVLIRVDDADALIEAAAQAGIRLRNQSAQPGLENCVRITIGNSEETSALIDFFQNQFSASEMNQEGR